MQVFPDFVSIATIVLPLVMGGLFLGPRPLPWFVIYNLVLLTLALPKVPSFTSRAVFSTVVMFLLAFIIMLASFRRSRLGIAGSMGESMLAELSDRIQGQGVLPDLPAPWHAESVIRSSGGTRFAGDFFVVGGIESGRLDVSVVDVSGKGDRAGSRALLLAGAMGGLVTALEPPEFLLGDQRLPDQPPVAGRLRHRGPPQRRPGVRRVPRLDRRPPAGPALAGRSGPLDAAGVRGADARPDPGRRLPAPPAVCSAPVTR